MRTAVPRQAPREPAGSAAHRAPTDITTLQQAGARGHALAEIPLRAPAPAAPLPLASAPGSGHGVLQLAPWWHRGLAGLGLVGGGLALALGAPVTGTLGLLAGGGYFAHRAWQRQQPGGVERQALEDQRDQLSGHRAGTRQRLLHDILSEGLGQLGTSTDISPEPSALGGGDTGRNGGRYTVRLDPKAKDPLVRQSYLLHELTHVSSDRVYRANRDHGREFYNVDEPVDVDDERSHPKYRELWKKADELGTLGWHDPKLTKEQKNHLNGRIAYLQQSPLREWDTVMTDLLYYAHVQGIPEDSATHQAIVEHAREAYLARQR